MKRFSFGAIGVIAVSLLAGCAIGTGRKTSMQDEPGYRNSFAITGRDLGRGGAASGGVSSLDRGGNAADYSLYEESQIAR